ncbi:hypothetical protein KAR91_02615 [Candidatus Pacearchaeota archaeon]|nr:hypothetical protein [Candidatus Pacearchaeota archaeon]
MKVRTVTKKPKHNLISDEDMFLSSLNVALAFIDRQWQPAFRVQVATAIEQYLKIDASSIAVGSKISKKAVRKILRMLDEINEELES